VPAIRTLKRTHNTRRVYAPASFNNTRRLTAPIYRAVPSAFGAGHTVLLLVRQPAGERLRRLRAHHPTVPRRLLKQIALGMVSFHCYPPPPWAVVI
jgi:hypothetical protein